MNFDELAVEYLDATRMSDLNAAHHKINALTKEAACNFPKDNPEELVWFKKALQDPNKKWFVVQIMEKVNPIPKHLLDDLVLASLLHQNSSSNRRYILPCVKTFGADVVKERIAKFKACPDVIANDGVDKILYWVK